MNEHFLVFTVDGHRCAVPLARVERVLRAVEVTALPSANLPSQVRGVVNVHGTVVLVFDLRETRLAEAVRESDQMILMALRDARQALFLCDEVQGVQEVTSAQIASHQDLLPDSLAAQGEVLTVGNELIYVNDLDALLEGNFWRQLGNPVQDTVPLSVGTSAP